MDRYQKIELYKRRAFGEKLGATFDFLRQNAGRYFKAQLIISGPIALLATIASSFIFGEMFQQVIQQNPEAMFSASYMTGIFGNIIINFFMVLVVMLVHFAYLKEYEQKPIVSITTQSIFQRVKDKLLPGIGATVIVYILTIVGFVLFVIPGIYVSVVGSLVLPILMMERISPVDAVGRAFRLITDKWWSTFGLLLVSGIVGSLVGNVIALPPTIAIFVEGLLSAESDPMNFAETTFSGWRLALINLFSYVGTIAQYSIVLCAVGFQYTNLIEMKESKGLLEEIDRMDEDEERGA